MTFRLGTVQLVNPKWSPNGPSVLVSVGSPSFDYMSASAGTHKLVFLPCYFQALSQFLQIVRSSYQAKEKSEKISSGGPPIHIATGIF